MKNNLWTFKPGDQVTVDGSEKIWTVKSELKKNEWDQTMFRVQDSAGEKKTRPWYQLRHYKTQKTNS